MSSNTGNGIDRAFSDVAEIALNKNPIPDSLKKYIKIIDTKNGKRIVGINKKSSKK